MRQKYFEIKSFIIIYLFSLSINILTINYIQKFTLYYGNKIIYSHKANEVNVVSLDSCKLQDILGKGMYNDLVLIKNNFIAEMDIRGIFCKNNPLFIASDGKFFDKEQCLSNKFIAIIGSGLKQFVYMENRESFIKIKNQKFKVIGYLDDKEYFDLRYAAFIPLKTSIDIFGSNGQYVVDGKSSEIKDFIDKIQNDNIKVIYPQIGFLEVLSLVFERSNEVVLLYGCILFFIIFSFIKGLNFWFDDNKSKLCVYKLLGFSDRIVITAFIESVLKNILLASLLGILSGNILLSWFSIDVTSFFLYIILYISTIILTVFYIITRVLKEVNSLKRKVNK